LKKFSSTAVCVKFLSFVFAVLVGIAAFPPLTASATPVFSEPQRLVVDAVDDSRQIAIPGNVRPEAVAENDRGVVENTLPLDHMQILLKRPIDREEALERLMIEQQTPGSPNYRSWLSAADFGERFGPATEDIAAVTTWLEQKGFRVNSVNAGRTMIDFSGNAGMVETAFGTQIHRLEVNGVQHIANMSDPRIPAALAGVVAGIVSLHDFRPHTNYKAKPKYTYTSGSSTLQALVPADLATIYNLNPVFSAGNTGAGQTIVLIEDTNVHATTDVSTFRSTFGLPAATFTQVHPSSCTNPGDVAGNDGEATLDVEWAGAAAPGAALELASCADTSTTFGGLIAIQNLINGSSPPTIMSVSYGECEAENGATANAAYVSTYQQAASEGVSVFVSSGDEGAASCDADETKSTHGIGVSGFASTPYNVAVGGTDFGDAYAGTTGTYWNTTNTSTYGSAKSYINEIPWNDSCASQLISSYNGSSTTYGSAGFCNSTTGKADYLTTASGSGGPSGCATGTASTSGVISGSCAGTAKPSWQSGILGNPSDGVRDIPDVSLFAANGVWGHYYIYCYTGSSADGGAACTGAPSGWSGAGGTSFASPIMAGIQALVNTKIGASVGNPASTYYALAKTEYGSSGSSSCNSSKGNAVGSTCIFYDVTQGDMDVNCTGTHNCYLPSGTNGVLSTSSSAYAPAYGTATGWDFATGIGTVNAANLVNGWPGGTAGYSLSTSPTSLSVTQGGSASTTVTVTDTNGFSGSVSLAASGLPSGVTAAFSPTSTATTSTLTLTASSSATTGSATITITGTSGSITETTTVSVTVSAAAQASFSLSASPTSLSENQGAAASTTISVTDINGFSGSVALSASGLPSGVTAAFSPASTTSTSTLTLTASSTATTGTSTVTITGTSGSLTETTTVSLTVSAVAQANYTLSASPTSLTEAQGAGASTTVTVTPSNGFTGSVALTASGLPTGVTAAFSPASTTSTSTLTLTASSTATVGTSTVTITGTSGSLSHTTTVSLTVSSAGGGVTQLLGNSGFENGTTTTPWTMTSGVINDSSSEPPYAGSWDAWLDGYGEKHTDTVSQSFTIPTGKTTATLAFYLHIDTAETTKTAKNDTLSVQILNSSGTVLGTVATFSNLNAASGYTMYSYSLSGYIGDTVTLEFTGTENSSKQTSFVLDNVTVNVQ